MFHPYTALTSSGAHVMLDHWLVCCLAGSATSHGIAFKGSPAGFAVYRCVCSCKQTCVKAAETWSVSIRVSPSNYMRQPL